MLTCDFLYFRFSASGPVADHDTSNNTTMHEAVALAPTTDLAQRESHIRTFGFTLRCKQLEFAYTVRILESRGRKKRL